MHHPLVSFCFTTFKRQEYLAQTLKSILAQTYIHFEIIISDNDPEGSAEKVVKDINDARIKYAVNAENLGMIKSFNKSLERSSGEYIVMIADDDPVYPDMLETLIKLHTTYPGYGMYLGGCNWFCTHPYIAHLYNIKVGTNSCLADIPVDTVTAYTPVEFLKNFFTFKILPGFLWSTCIVKREIMIEKGGVPDYNTPFMGDYAYIAIMASHSGCVVINRALGHQTIHEQNFGRNHNEQLKYAVTNFANYVSSKVNPIQDWPEIERIINRFIAIWAITHLNFIDRYNKKFNKEKVDLSGVEKELFSVPIMKPHRFKYFMKKNFPKLHDGLVVLKRKLK